MSPINLIDNLRKTDWYIEVIFMHGACYKFYLFLKTRFPNARPMINEDKNHIATDIDGRLYDIKGYVDTNKENYDYLNPEELEMVENWSFKNNNALKLTECPACEEPITV